MSMGNSLSVEQGHLGAGSHASRERFLLFCRSNPSVFLPEGIVCLFLSFVFSGKDIYYSTRIASYHHTHTHTTYDTYTHKHKTQQETVLAIGTLLLLVLVLAWSAPSHTAFLQHILILGRRLLHTSLHIIVHY